jgi:hypothetical protein
MIVNTCLAVGAVVTATHGWYRFTNVRTMAAAQKDLPLAWHDLTATAR